MNFSICKKSNSHNICMHFYIFNLPCIFLQAQLRASVFLALEEQESVQVCSRQCFCFVIVCSVCTQQADTES